MQSVRGRPTPLVPVPPFGRLALLLPKNCRLSNLVPTYIPIFGLTVFLFRPETRGRLPNTPFTNPSSYAAALSRNPSPAPLLPPPSSPMGNTPSNNTALQTCLNSIFTSNPGAVSYPSDALYQLTAVKAYNSDIPITPAAVVRPSTTDEVSRVVQCAVASSLKVQPRSGGHSYGNYCLGQSTTFPSFPFAVHSPRTL
jgi:FAD binding domain